MVISIIFFFLILIIMLCFLILKQIRKYILRSIKIHFLSLNYFAMSRVDSYYSYYNKIIHWHLFFLENNKIIIYLFKGKKTINLLCFFVDVIFHDLVLIWFSAALPFYSVYQLFYGMNAFLQSKINIQFDWITCSWVYKYYLHERKLLREYKQLMSKNEVIIPFEVYSVVNLFGSSPIEIDLETEVLVNKYLVSLLQ